MSKQLSRLQIASLSEGEEQRTSTTIDLYDRHPEKKRKTTNCMVCLNSVYLFHQKNISTVF